MINKDRLFKLACIASYLLLVFLQAQPVLAEPPQRLIIQFDTPLSAQQQKTLVLQIQSIIQSGFSVLPHSTDQKWIIVINPPIDKENFEKANAEIIRLEHVRYIETDLMMNALPRNE